jgi:hypothetical protein
MPTFNVTPNSKRTRVMTSQSAGTTTVNSSIIDTADFATTVFETLFGTCTTGQVTTIKVQGGNASDGSDMADLANSHITLADPGTGLMVVHEIVESVYRYLRLVVARSIQNVAIDGVVAIQSGAHRAPTTDDSSTVQARNVLVSPATGTA